MNSGVVNVRSNQRKHLMGWAALPVMAVLNGLVRDTTYGSMLAHDAAHSLSVLPLSVAIVVWSRFLARRWPLDTPAALRVGGAWLVLTLGFEFGLGAIQGMTFRAMISEYDVSDGKLWPLIPLLTIVAPVLFGGRRSSTERSTSSRSGDCPDTERG
jgi:hypothetical protein